MNKATTLLSLLLAAAGTFQSAECSTLKDYEPYDPEKGSKIIFSESFENPSPGWKNLRKNYKIKRGFGQNATGGMMLQRKPGEKYYFCTHPLKLTPGKHYRLKTMVAMRGVKNGKGQLVGNSVQSIGVDFSDKEKYIRSEYLKTKLSGGKLEWQERFIDFTTPANHTRATLCLFLKRPMSCDAVQWDDITITELGDTPPEIFTIHPKHLHPNQEGYVKVWLYDFLAAKRPESQLKVFAVINGKEFSAKVKGGYAEFKVGKLAAGQHKIVFHIADTKGRKIILSREFPLFVTTEKAPVGRVVTEEDGRVLVDGKPFFPLGFFFENPANMKPQRMASLRKVGVNTVLPYRSMRMLLGKEKKKIGVKAVKQSMDALHKNDIKVIFSLLEVTGTVQKKIPVYDGITDTTKQAEHVISNLRNHPALLGWYISDENPAAMLDPIKALREQTNRIDPYHPAITLTNIPDNMVFFGKTGDILMFDKYPIRRKSQPTSMKELHYGFNKALAEGRLGWWFVPQCFNWGIYKRDESMDDYRYPTELELRSQCLLAMNYRTRGIIFYAYCSLARQAERDPANGKIDVHRPRVLRVINLMSSLTPFMLVKEKPVKLDVKSAGDSLVEAMRHTANGKEIVVITSIGPGKGDAVINAGRTGLKSRFGFTKELGGGKYKFVSEGIASDILE